MGDRRGASCCRDRVRASRGARAASAGSGSLRRGRVMARQRSAPRPDWPTLDEQLAAGKVASGTPLHQFILENQDFSLLRPEEATDDLDLPLWIRVYWRRLHPELEFPAGDPTGGY